MSFQDVVQVAQEQFPDLQIAYKDQSTFMKILGTIMFFNKDFMNNYITTIGSTVYFPSENFIKNDPDDSAVVLMHELVHVYDSKKYTSVLFKLGYLFPQILSVISLFLFFVSWKIALPLVVFFLLPLPAPFRMYFEKRGYLVSAYADWQVAKKLNVDPQMTIQEQFYVEQFKGSGYYFMWPFSNIQTDFDQAVTLINQGKHPYDDAIFVTIDKMIAKL